VYKVIWHFMNHQNCVILISQS